MKKIKEIILRVWWLWPILSGGVVFGLCMLLSAGQSLWFDEGYSIALAQQPVGELLALTAVDAHPPFYYLLLKAWAGIFGWGEFALRSLSAVFAGGAVVAAFFLVKRLFNLKTALLFLPFVVIAPFLLRYGYEVRMYALVGFIGVLATLVLTYALQAKKLWLWAVYTLLVAAGMYTLYFSIAIWAAHAIYLLVGTIRAHRPLFKEKWLFAFVGAVVLFIPYLSTFIYQMTHSALPGIGGQLTLTTLGGILSLMLAYVTDWQQTGLLALILLVVLVLTIAAGVFVYRKATQKHREGLRLLIVMAVVPILIFMLVSIFQNAFVYRYMAHVIIFLYILTGTVIALALQSDRARRAILLAVLALALLTYGVVNLSKNGNFVFERMQTPQTQQVRSVIDCNTAVVVADDPYTFIDSRYYFDGCDLRFFSKDTVEKKGGYAVLSGSPLRVSDPSTLTGDVIYHLRWNGQESQFTPSSRYSLQASTQFDKQVVDTYVLNAE